MSTNSPTISILIITYNRCDDCLALLKSLEGQHRINEFVGEILLLNNNSSDSYQPIIAFIQNSLLPIKYLQHQENLGVAGGRNFLIDRAQFPYLLVLDDDVEFDQSDAIVKVAGLWDKELFQKNNTAVITLNIHYYETRERQRNALPHKNYKEYKDKDSFLTYYFTGAAHLMKKEIFSKVGKYPQDFFYGMEEYDLSYRVINAGYTLGYDNSVLVWHKESAQGRMPNREKLKMMWYNKCVVAWKYLPERYYHSTARMWGLYYLRYSGFDLKGYFENRKRIKAIPQKVERRPISNRALNYLYEVKARLSY